MGRDKEKYSGSELDSPGGSEDSNWLIKLLEAVGKFLKSERKFGDKIAW